MLMRGKLPRLMAARPTASPPTHSFPPPLPIHPPARPPAAPPSGRRAAAGRLWAPHSIPSHPPLPTHPTPARSPDELLLGDFGLAIHQGREAPFLRAGTLDYMSPEARLLAAVTPLPPEMMRERGWRAGGTGPLSSAAGCR